MKKYLLILLTIAYIIVHPSCGKDVPLVEENGVIVSVPYEWKRQLHKRNQFNSNSIIDEHLVYNGNPIIATTEGEGDRWINLIDIETGKDIWKWNDNFWGSDEKFSVLYAHFYNNLMTYQVGSRSYCINMDNGNTHWKIQEDRSFHARVSGLDSHAFLLGPPKDTLEGYTTYVGYEREMNTGQVNQFLFTDIDFNSGGEANRITRIFNIEPFKTSDDKTYLLVVSYDQLPNWYQNQFVGLYNYSDREWIYNRKMISETNGGTSYVEIVGDKAYMTAAHSMNCIDIWTGEVLWTSPTEAAIGISSFVVKEGKVIGQDEAQLVYGWNAETGQELWRVAGAGTSSRLRYLNGIVYFSGGSTSRIHAIDISTGKTVWLLKPELMEKGADDFKPDIYAIEGKNGEKGKIVICTPMNAYCLEAYQ
jgi:outer membrane protein assembly factor BamB